MELRRRSFPSLPFPSWTPLLLVIPALAGLLFWAGFPEVVGAHGVMEPGEFCVLTAPRSGALEVSRLNGAGEFAAGEVLFRLETKTLDAEVATASAEWSEAVAHKNRLEKELELRQLAFEAITATRNREAARYARLVSAGAASSRERDAWETSSEDEHAERLRVLTELNREYTVVVSQMEPMFKRKTALEAERTAQEFRAPFQGKILRTMGLDPAKPFLGTAPGSGRFVSAGQVLGYFGKSGSLAVRLTLPDTVRDRVFTGMKVRWYPVGYPASRHHEMTGYLFSMEPSHEPGSFWALVRPDQETLKRAGGMDLWGLGVIAQLEVDSRPLIDRWFSP